tara:strand:+ start:780 stop:1709 length:930 start_codon:yes stop_codon:yes gene_type:complete
MSKLATDVDSKYQLYREAVKSHNIALKKLNVFYENYLNIPDKNNEYLDKNVKDSSGNHYYVTPQGLLKKTKGSEDFLGNDCPTGAPTSTLTSEYPQETLMTNLSVDSSERIPKNKIDNYFIGGKPMTLNQPCNFFNQETSINLPDKSSNRQMKMCTYVFQDPAKSNMVEHDDLNSSSIEECRVRAEDIGHDAFGLIKTNPTDLRGVCYTGMKEKVPSEDASKIEKQQIINTDKKNTTLTLLRNGNLIMWAPDANNSNYFNDEKEFQENVVLWSSNSQGGKTDNRCDPVFGGAINNINVTYGTNCGINLF